MKDEFTSRLLSDQELKEIEDTAIERGFDEEMVWLLLGHIASLKQENQNGKVD